MELDIGKYCEECSRVDFLPIKCLHCGKFLCKDHFQSHKPCASESNTTNVTSNETEKLKIKCAVCSEVTIMKYQCRCGTVVCLKHRNHCPDTTQDDTQTEEKTWKAIQLLSDHKLPLPGERWSSKSTAEPSTSHTLKPITALEVMRLKKTEPITGKIAKGERAYCIFTDTRKCIVVNREWSLGKVFHVCGITDGQKLNDIPSESINKQDTCNTILRNTGVLKDTILISE
ncbi:hypothetical protein MP638_002001 [Amoeboaphelidium occidentale]|nr:hypothetical protein MP638_002001 [Amoeboaphelidium occidentale]